MVESKLAKGEDFDLVPLVGVDSWEISPTSIVLETKLGHGSFGDVYKGMVQRGTEETDGVNNEKKVAIKVIKGDNNHNVRIASRPPSGFLHEVYVA